MSAKANIEEISEIFNQYNINLTEDILIKCLELAVRYYLNAEGFVEEWLSYSVSHLNGAPPTLKTLDKMELFHLSKIKNLKPPEEDPVIEVYEPPPVVYNPSQRFTQRNDSKTVLFTYGVPTIENNNTTNPPDIKWNKIENPIYPLEDVVLTAKSIENLTLKIAKEITNKHDINLSTNSIRINQGKAIVAGRIYPLNPNEKLNKSNIGFETSHLYHQGFTVQLKFNKDDLKYSLFPGQVVVIDGINVKKNLLVEKIYYESEQSNNTTSASCLTNIVIASGPFTLPENLLFEPLNDLLKLIKENKPNVVILLGPFLEENHHSFQTINERYDKLYDNIFNDIMNQLPSNIEVLIIPSEKDILSFPVFPNYPFSIKNPYKNLKFLSNPSVIDINNIKIGAISTDILFHLSKNEISTFSSSRMMRLTSHLLNQKCFYPLYPSDSDISLCYTLLEKFGCINDKLDILIVPSNLRYFVHNINETIAINPERICKGDGAGTYANVQINATTGPISSRISCQIIKI